MDERIIDRKLFIDLANEVGLNASHIEAMGEMRHCEITVSGNMLERLVEIQHQFERFAVMGDDEYRGFYIEVPRPTSEEWGDVEELIASGEYQSKDAFLADWLAFNPTETFSHFLIQLLRNFFRAEIVPAAFNCGIIVNNARLGIVLGCSRLADQTDGSKNADCECSGETDNGEDDECSGLRVPFFKFVHNFVLSVLGRGTALRLVARPV